MVALSVNASADRIRARAAALDPVKVLITVVIAPLWLVGYLLRTVWYVVAFLIAGGMEGWDVCGRQIEARRSDARGG